MGVKMVSGSKRPYSLLIALLTLISPLFLIVPVAYATDTQAVVVEVFKEDKVHLDIGDETHVTRTLTIQNVVDKPLVPGQITLVLQKRSPHKLGPIPIPFTSEMTPVEVSYVKARASDGSNITDLRIIHGENSTTIQYGAWMPIEPKGTLTIVLEYDTPDIVERGILFNTLQYPFTSSSIPVEKAIVEVNPGNNHVTYAKEKPLRSGDVYVWEKPRLGMDSWEVALEYSILPLPLLPFNGSVLFWGILLLLCLAWVIWTRPRKRP
ncbi:MAG: hypothetical protein ACM3QV_00115 [Caulobacteraceae bacterium]